MKKEETDQMLLCSFQEKALGKLLFKMRFSFQNTSCHRFWLDSHISTLETRGWAGIKSPVNVQPFSSCFQLVFGSSQAHHNG